MSDHGAGGAHTGSAPERRLEECGLLRAPVDASAGPGRPGAVHSMQPACAAAAPPHALFRARAALPRASRAPHSLAASIGGEPQPSRRGQHAALRLLNLAGAKSGSLSEADRKRVLRDVIDAVLDGLPAAAPWWRAAPTLRGVPGPSRAARIWIELGLDAGFGLSLVPTRGAKGNANVRSLPRTLRRRSRPVSERVHRPTASSSCCRTMQLSRDSLAFAPASCGRCHPMVGRGASPPTPAPYTLEEEAAVAARLRALGYLE